MGSIESPEAFILARQMDAALRGKRVRSAELVDAERFQRLGFFQKDTSGYESLAGGRVLCAVSRGNTMLLRLDNGMGLVLFPEYGGVFRFHAPGAPIEERHNFRLALDDGSSLTLRLTGMGGAQALPDDRLGESYVYRRDFSGKPDPVQAADFTLERFSEALGAVNRALKSALVGKDAVVVGLGNAAFQDIAYEARLYPARKAASLGEAERQALFEAIKHVVSERVRLGGKQDFVDLYGVAGRYTPAISPQMAGEPCPRCGTPIARFAIGGGPTVYCPGCQKVSG